MTTHRQTTTNLSVVYAVHNEEANLARSLDSVKDLADEIIIVDGGSSDDTVKIAKKYGAQVIETTNKPIFHINKQMAMDAAKGRWVLQMDADEVVDADMAAGIAAIVQATTNERIESAYWLKRRNWFLGTFLTKGGQYPDPVIRFYQNGKAHLPMITVHEQMEVDGTVGWLPGHLLHYSNPTFSEYLNKANRYTTLTALEMQAKAVPLSFSTAVKFLLVKPTFTFLSLYIRHKGFYDGFPGFIFALMSGWHHALAYCKYWELEKTSTS
jgi:glycosyltransferase involved in cell wall biosynthesis